MVLQSYQLCHLMSCLKSVSPENTYRENKYTVLFRSNYKKVLESTNFHTNLTWIKTWYIIRSWCWKSSSTVIGRIRRIKYKKLLTYFFMFYLNQQKVLQGIYPFGILIYLMLSMLSIEIWSIINEKAAKIF